jgi:hypothetical protein
VAPVVVIAFPEVYANQVPPLSMLTLYSSAAPVDPPEPADPVTVPVLNPAQMVAPSAGVAVPNVGGTGADPTIHVQMVVQDVAEHPLPEPPVLRD